ncbi:ribonuclease T2 family protein [Sphingomonas radiodurans]|uniref:ribonuclease T2 family protein n=1 Tax=Sphingomonas radiodurans TaxID=2890321 RepID=UPI001E4DBEF7|nr:ribonuclease T [Sphingomonas radiodurans]WBH17055.1 ribonuclease T [Sphingomonas radiodurans]
MIRAAAALLLLAPGVASAQAYSCAVPDAAALTVRPDLPSEREPQRLLPIGHYTLAISWSPQYCRAPDKAARSRFQCGGASRFGFVLHGLWPDGVGEKWPQYCKSTTLIPAATLRANMCATPSAQLLQHEWAKHGTCMAGETPESYFRRSTALFRELRYPDMVALSRRPLTAGRLATAIARVNPGMRADMMRITTDRGGWLDEVWLCMDKSFRYARCPAHQGGVKLNARVKIWRGRR